MKMKTSHILIAVAVGGAAYYWWKKGSKGTMPTSGWLGSLKNAVSGIGNVFKSGAPTPASGTGGYTPTGLLDAGDAAPVTYGSTDPNTDAWSSSGDSAFSNVLGVGGKGGNDGPSEPGSLFDASGTSNMPSSLDDLTGGSSFQLS